MDRKKIERRVRRSARSWGYQVLKSRKGRSADNFGQYMVVDPHNTVVLGSRFDATLEQIEDFFESMMARHQGHHYYRTIQLGEGAEWARRKAFD
jgi:hypothetical protein